MKFRRETRKFVISFLVNKDAPEVDVTIDNISIIPKEQQCCEPYIDELNVKAIKMEVTEP